MSFVSEWRRSRPKASLDAELRRLFRVYGREAVIGRAVRLHPVPSRPRGGQPGQRIDDHEALLRAALLHRKDPSRSVENILREVVEDFGQTTTREAHVRRLRRRLNEGWTSGKNYLDAFDPPYGDFRLSYLALAARTGQPVLVHKGLLGVLAPVIGRQTTDYLSRTKSIDKTTAQMYELRNIILEFLLNTQCDGKWESRHFIELELLADAASTHDDFAEFLRERAVDIKSTLDIEGASEEDHLSEDQES